MIAYMEVGLVRARIAIRHREFDADAVVHAGIWLQVGRRVVAVSSRSTMLEVHLRRRSRPIDRLDLRPVVRARRARGRA